MTKSELIKAYKANTISIEDFNEKAYDLGMTFEEIMGAVEAKENDLPNWNADEKDSTWFTPLTNEDLGIYEPSTLTKTCWIVR